MESPNTTSSCTPLSPSIVLLYQQALISSMALVITILLKPFRIPPMVSTFLAGIVLGPTFFGRISLYESYVFPKISMQVLNFFSRSGMTLQMFYIGITINPKILVKPDQKIIVIGIAVVLLPLGLALLSAYVLTKVANPENNLYLVGLAQSMNSFPVIATYLHELKLVNSELSRVAFSCAMISGFIWFVFTLMHVDLRKGLALLTSGFYYIVGFIIIVYILRPLLMWMIEAMPKGKKISNGQFTAVVITALMLSYLGMTAGIHQYFGPFLFGIIIPAGPLASALVEKLHFFTTWMVMPVYYTLHGQGINLFLVDTKTFFYTEIMVLTCWIGKFLGAFLPALHYNMSLKEGILLGIIMNATGFTEIAYTRVLKNRKWITVGSYNIICVSVLVLTGIFAPVARYIYKSSLRYKLHYLRNLQHSAESSEFRVLACLFKEENVPSIIHFLRAISHPQDSPINATIVRFQELVGRSAPFIVSHKIGKKWSEESDLASQRFLNVFRGFEENDRRVVSVHPYTATSPYRSMHVDVCAISIRKRCPLIILPFHEQTSTEVNVNIRTVNCNVLGKAPCSVGIIIDRGRLGGSKYVLESWISYNVAVLFFDGADDREALALGERMLGNSTIELTVIRFSQVGSKVDTTLDDEMVNEFLVRNGGNVRMTYIQQEVTKAVEIVKTLEAMKDRYELIILGKRHDKVSSPVVELTSWLKYPELGTMGDIFVTSDYGGKATILVIQQQRDVIEGQ
ncbi:hypothetical protein ACHQM5_028979 [Ranunculus cassubicifolius]